MNLQYQLSNGNWADCGITDGNRTHQKTDRTDEFLARCIGRRTRTKTGWSEPIANIAEAVALLESGREISIGSDWYANVRIKPAPIAPRAPDTRPVLRCTVCGETGHRGAYPFSTLPGSGRCDDCV